MPEKKSAHLSIMGIKLLLLSAISLAVWGCVQPQPAGTGEMDSTAQGTQASKILSPEEQALLEAQTASELQNTDCAKCHDSQPSDIDNNGASHKTAIGCQDCHLEHLPSGTQTIPQCSMCHDAIVQGHFGLGDSKVCLGCHSNPHTPLIITMVDVPETSKVCFTCHGEKQEEFQAFPSKHSQQNCTFCHPDKHKVINKCFTCHEKNAFHGGNGSFMVYEDCLGCHKPHSPLEITYSAETPSNFCGTCHGELLTSLSANQSKHKDLACVFCHKDKHPTVPNCRDCHDQPHSASMLTSFNEDCLKCHRNPHDLIY